MSIEEVRNAMHQAPFPPFTVQTAGGQACFVRHPDFIAASPTGRTITVWDDAGHHLLDLRLVVGITNLKATAGAE